MTITNQILFNPTQLVLELDEATVDRAWQTSQVTTGNSTSRWQRYLNQLALDTILPWLQAEEDETAKAGLNEAVRADIWEVVNGTIINLNDAKIVLIPTEAEDLSELRVPQEWIDIPEWKADYYLAVQVSIDAGFVRVWGYATHQQLKNNGNFSHSDRTYSLSDDELIADINVLWVARELCPDEVTQAAVEPINDLDPDRADSLIERLGSQSQLLPRLAVPFTTWATLIKNPQWCGRLTAKRRGEATKTPVLQWFKRGIANMATEFGWRQIEMTADTLGARGINIPELTSNLVPTVGFAKQIAIANQPYELRVFPLGESGSWRFELGCLTPGCVILPGVRLRLLTEDLQSFEGNEEVATEPVPLLFIEVDLEEGESLVWQAEPTPDNYQQEVLQF
ncbi:DUF1822 family protein [Waterburya agarophytonicola K14]|uniref:DUF1822 family protein n=1 Tax=Waterburya agarophytonicola KI4 TaxID=2874699 RepID=A0A964FDS9_9CYAN|nr:DUF1822 family protein [Waterburya agarophytonicola]MCC0175960.1 DUF1822 family protein [Waterburya agarophytonicola KI4]